MTRKKCSVELFHALLPRLVEGPAKLGERTKREREELVHDRPDVAGSIFHRRASQADAEIGKDGLGRLRAHCERVLEVLDFIEHCDGKVCLREGDSIVGYRLVGGDHEAGRILDRSEIEPGHAIVYVPST